MAATSKTTPTAESPEHVNIEFWQTTQASITLDENGKPPFYQECSDAIRYSTSIMTTLIQTFTQPFYHATCPLNPSSSSPPICPSTISYSGDRATTRSKLPGLDVAHERELFYITSSILQITKASAVTLRLAENYLNRITPLITQLRAHGMTEQAGHVDCCWTLASLKASKVSSTQPLCPLPSCETSHPPLIPDDGENDGEHDHSLPHPSSVTLPLRLDPDGRLSPDLFTQPCHTCDPAALAILRDRPVMTLTAALLLAAKTVNESGFWLRRIAHTTVQNIDELKACERALLRALAWHTTYVPVPGVDSPAVTHTLGVRDGRAPAADLAPVLGEAPTYYQCIPWLLWQYTAHAHAPELHAAIAAAFMRPCSFVPKDAQREILEHLAWLSRTVSGALLPAPAQWEHVVERKRLDLLVGVVERLPLVPIPIPISSPSPSSTVGPVRFRRVSSAARRRDSRMLKHIVDIVLKKPKRSRSVDAL